jgi:hypothetical protein
MSNTKSGIQTMRVESNIEIDLPSYIESGPYIPRNNNYVTLTQLC